MTDKKLNQEAVAAEISRLTEDNHKILDEFVALLPVAKEVIHQMKHFCIATDITQLHYHYEKALAALSTIEPDMSPNDAMALGLALTRGLSFDEKRLEVTPQSELSLH